MINILVWDDSLSTGYPEIDLQHKKLISIIDDVHNAMQESSGEYAMKMAKDLKRLTDYTEYHFNEEELFMKRYAYPDFENHKKEHTNFIEQVMKQIQTLKQSNPDDGYRFYRFLGTWLINHIAKQDHAWAAFIQDIESKKS